MPQQIFQQDLQRKRQLRDRRKGGLEKLEAVDLNRTGAYLKRGPSAEAVQDGHGSSPKNRDRTTRARPPASPHSPSDAGRSPRSTASIHRTQQGCAPDLGSETKSKPC